MAKIKGVNNTDGSHYGWRFDCPGCNEPHVLTGWTFNNNQESPTFSPSVLVQYNGVDADNGGPASRCHSYVTDGRIQFLSDSTHNLSGQTVDLPDIKNS